jgi:hypothetical protein
MRSTVLSLSILLITALTVVSLSAQTTTPPPAPAQSNTSVPPQGWEEKMKEMEERVIALEGQVRMLKAAQSPAAPAAGTVPTQPAPTQTASTTTTAEQGGQAPVYGGAASNAKALNPDISVIGDFIGVGGRNHIAPMPAFQMHESELGLQAIIDPYARGDFFISFGEQGVDLEEGYITFTALPAGLVVRGGKMRAAFGKVNTLHNHVLSWIDRPLVTSNLVGGEDGINDAGLSVTRIFSGPKGLFLEGTAQLFRGDSDEVFKSNMRSDVSTVGHLRAYKDITESTNVDVGVSYARGHNDAGSAFLSNLYGIDATVRWKPLRRSIYHSFLSRSEFIWSQREQAPTPQLAGMQRAFGFYSSADYQFARRWFFGGRYDYSQRASNASLLDRGASAILTYWPSEFSQVRAQYRLTHYAEGMDANEVLMQLQFSLGAHGAHPF